VESRRKLSCTIGRISTLLNWRNRFHQRNVSKKNPHNQRIRHIFTFLRIKLCLIHAGKSILSDEFVYEKHLTENGKAEDQPAPAVQFEVLEPALAILGLKANNSCPQVIAAVTKSMQL